MERGAWPDGIVTVCGIASGLRPLAMTVRMFGATAPRNDSADVRGCGPSQ
jgi:hypothetical protein